MSEAINLIERYFDNQLSDEELKLFQRRLGEDADFAKAFQLEKDLMEGIEVMGNKNLKNELDQIYQEEIISKASTSAPPASEKRNNNPRRLWLASAAAIALLLVFWWLNRTPSAENLYVEYFQPEFDFSVKSGDNSLLSNSLLSNEVQTLLRNRNYKSAIPKLNELIRISPENNEYQLALGLALIEEGQFEEGISMLKALEENKFYKTNANWYIALAYLKKNDVSMSHQLLSASLGQYEHSKAKKLIDDLESLLE